VRFDRTEPGLWVSGAAHAAILAACIFGFASAKFPEAEEGIPVEVVTESQLSQITRGDLNAKAPAPDPKPRVDRRAETEVQRDPGEATQDAPAPPKRPAEMKLAEEAVEAAAAPPPPPPAPPARPEPARADPKPAPEPPRRDELKLAEQAQAEAIAQAKAEAEAKAKADAEAKARAAAAAKAKAEAEARKAMAEAVAKAEADAQREKQAAEAAKAKAEKEAKLRAEAKAKVDAEAKARKQAEIADKFDAGDIRQLLASKAPSQSTGSTGRDINKTASLGTATGTSQHLNPSQRDQLMGLLRDQLHRCWTAPIAAQGADKPPVPAVRVRLNQDGTLAAEPAVLNGPGDPLFRVVADSATRATRRCAPLRIPAQFAPYYQDWKDLVVNFDPREMG
jgi:colicin import membrane protein